jgi:2-polyprenyl-6-methoxyphenol hydroxylase-like FAD-dependent oxidoreductase
MHLGCRAETLQEHGSGMRVRCASGVSFDADLVVGADGPAAQVRDVYLASLPERLAWIHGYDILAQNWQEQSATSTRTGRGQRAAGTTPSFPARTMM